MKVTNQARRDLNSMDFYVIYQAIVLHPISKDREVGCKQEGQTSDIVSQSH